MDIFGNLGVKTTPAFDSAVLEPEPKPKKTWKGQIRFLCSSDISKRITGNGTGGDDRIVWDRRFKDQMDEARAKFNELVGLGYKAYLVKKDGKKSNEQLLEFLPEAEEVIMVPPTAAG